MKILKNSKLETKSIINGKSLTVTALILLFMTVLLLSTNIAQAQSDKKELVRKVARDWIAIGKKQYDRGLYIDAEQSLLKAKDYEAYLTAEESKILSELFEKTHLSVKERATVEVHLEQAKKLMEQGNLDEARLNFEKIKDSNVLTTEEQKLITESLSSIARQQNILGDETIKLFNDSVKLFNFGQLEQARKGFVEVAKSSVMVSSNGKTAEDYLMQIDDILIQRAQQEDIQPEQPAVETMPKIEESPSISAQSPGLDSKQNLLRSYATAIVNGAIIKVEEDISQGEYEKARQSVTEAMAVISENRENLGDELFHQYIGDLEHLTREIIKGEQSNPLEDVQQQVIEMQKKQQEKKIEVLTEQAIEYIKQGQYQDAIKALKDLLYIKNIPLEEG